VVVKEQQDSIQENSNLKMNDTEKVYQPVGRPGCGLSNRKIGVRYHGAGTSLLSRVAD